MQSSYNIFSFSLVTRRKKEFPTRSQVSEVGRTAAEGSNVEVRMVGPLEKQIKRPK